jgi:hypothetical protein
VTYGELSAGTNTITATFVKLPAMTLDLISSGEGDLNIDSPGGPLSTVVLEYGDEVGDFVILPSYGWFVESIVLITGDGVSLTITDSARAASFTIGYSELRSGTNTMTVIFVKLPAMTLDLISSGEGEFYIDSAGGPVYTVVLEYGDEVSGFVISPSYGWVIGSVVLITGDGVSLTITDSARSASFTIGYDELTAGTNTITVTFVIEGTGPVDPPGPHGGGPTGQGPHTLLLLLLLFAIPFIWAVLLWVNGGTVVSGTVTHKGKGLDDVEIEYAIDGNKGYVTTNADGGYTITVPRGSEVMLPSVVKKGYAVSGATMDGKAVREYTTLSFGIHKKRTEVDFVM